MSHALLIMLMINLKGFFFIITSFDNPILLNFVLIALFKFVYNMIRPANVPEGAYVQWEIELLDFNTQKVIEPTTNN